MHSWTEAEKLRRAIDFLPMYPTKEGFRVVTRIFLRLPFLCRDVLNYYLHTLLNGSQYTYKYNITSLNQQSVRINFLTPVTLYNSLSI